MSLTFRGLGKLGGRTLRTVPQAEPHRGDAKGGDSGGLPNLTLLQLVATVNI
jgi:hypothetical protein